MATATASTNGDQAQEAKVPAIEQKYGAEAVRASKRARELTGTAGPTPKQYRAVVDALKGENPVDLLGTLDPAMTQKELKEIADGSAKRGQGRRLQPIADRVNGNAWTKGRNLAATMVAWIEATKRA